MTEYAPHPIAEHLPAMSPEVYDAFKARMAVNGYDARFPIVLYEDRILDGRHRYRASLELGLTPAFIRVNGECNPWEVALTGEMRRHYQDQTHKFMCLNPLIEGSAAWQEEQERSRDEANRARSEAAKGHEFRGNRHTGSVASGEPTSGGLTTKPKNRQKAKTKGAAVSVGRKAVELGEWLERHASTEILSAVRAGKLTAKNAKRQVEKEQRAAEIAAIASQLMPITQRFRLVSEDCAEALTTETPESFDWIITDPPYGHEYLDAYSLLAELAVKLLKPGGSLLCMTGQAYLPDVAQRLAEHLVYHWTLAYLTPGGQAVQIFPRCVNTFWKPVLWFTRGAFTGGWVGDVTRSNTNDNDKTRHCWGQSESGMRDLMSRFVKPNDRILDPFMGAGTTGVIALELGATFVGYDRAEASYQESLGRMTDGHTIN